jgi:hypothetical protein
LEFALGELQFVALRDNGKRRSSEKEGGSEDHSEFTMRNPTAAANVLARARTNGQRRATGLAENPEGEGRNDRRIGTCVVYKERSTGVPSPRDRGVMEGRIISALRGVVFIAEDPWAEEFGTPRFYWPLGSVRSWVEQASGGGGLDGNAAWRLARSAASCPSPPTRSDR